MKRTILATAIIAASSFNAMAESKGDPSFELGQNTTVEQQAAVFNHLVGDNGSAEVVEGVLVIKDSSDKVQNAEWAKNELKASAITNGKSKPVDRKEVGKNLINNHTNATITDNGVVTYIDSDGIYQTVDLSMVSPAVMDEVKRLAKIEVQANADERRKDIIVPDYPTPIAGVPVSREDAVSYVKTHGLTNLDNLDKAIQYRKNNEDKFDFGSLTAEQKVAALNEVANDEFILVHNAAGELSVYNDSTGEYVTDADIADAKKQVQQEAAKRAEDQPSLPVEPTDPTPMPQPIGSPEAKEAVIAALTEKAEEIRAELPEVGENANGSVQKHVQAAQAQNQAQIDELYALGNQNASDIDTLFSEVDRLDTRIDQTQALNAATVNARPMVTNGMTAFGAGVGYAGSEAALAIGVAHSFVDTGWSASGTLAASSDDVVVGGGVQYAF